MTEKKIAGQSFRPGTDRAAQGNGSGPRVLSYYEPATVSTTTKLDHAGKYQLVVDLTAAERYVDGVFDYNKCRLTFKADGQKLLEQDFSRQDGRAYHFVYDRDWQPGTHELTFEIKPLTSETKVRNLSIRINSVTLRGPLEEKYWTRPPNYAHSSPATCPRALPNAGNMPSSCWVRFATRAFRRPVDDVDAEPAGRPGRAGIRDQEANVRGGHFAGHGGGAVVAPVPLPRGRNRAGLDRPVSR